MLKNQDFWPKYNMHIEVKTKSVLHELERTTLMTGPASIRYQKEGSSKECPQRAECVTHITPH